MGNMQNLYRVLGVSENASADEIKSSYRRLAKKYHPDTNHGDPAEEKQFQSISEAYSILGNPQKKKAYDERFKRTKEAEKTTFHAETKGGRMQKTQAQKRNPLDTTDMFERFMGIKR